MTFSGACSKRQYFNVKEEKSQLAPVYEPDAASRREVVAVRGKVGLAGSLGKKYGSAEKYIGAGVEGPHTFCLPDRAVGGTPQALLVLVFLVLLVVVVVSQSLSLVAHRISRTRPWMRSDSDCRHNLIE